MKAFFFFARFGVNLWRKIYAVMILQSSSIKITYDVKPSAQECGPQERASEGPEPRRQRGPGSELHRGKNRALMACSDMGECGKQTAIFIKENAGIIY